jgi:hypothetical protein
MHYLVTPMTMLLYMFPFCRALKQKTAKKTCFFASFTGRMPKSGIAPLTSAYNQT